MRATPLVSAVALALALPTLAFASPSVEKITVTPSPAKAGSPVTITIDASDADSGICGLDVNLGDGNRLPPMKVGGGQQRTFPVTLQHTYAKAGNYEVKADGRRADAVLGCLGKVKYMLTVEAGAAPAATPAAAAATPGTLCPDGWKLKGKARKDGSYTCAPKAKGAKKPEKELACPAGTGYFYGAKALGCEKVQ